MVKDARLTSCAAPPPGAARRLKGGCSQDWLPEESGWFAVHVVELPGCVSEGATVEEAKANIANALESYVEVLLETAVRSQTAKLLAPAV